MKSLANVSSGQNLSIQGLRGVAVLAVLIFHYVSVYRNDILSGVTPGHALLHLANVGWVGVDLFFAISGFVVTSSILSSVRKPTDVFTFWRRRALRLFPVYYLAVFVFSICLILGLATTAGYARAIPFLLLHLSNIGIVIGVPMQDPMISITHFWSLAVEMQFYFAWPWLLVFRHRLPLKSLMLAVVILAPLARGVALLYGLQPNTIYSLTPFRLDAFIVAALIALRHHEGGLTQRTDVLMNLIFPTTGILALAYLASSEEWHKADPTVQIYGYSLLAISSGCLVGSLFRQTAPVWLQALLSRPAIVWIGTISYSLYVWHLLFSGLISAQFRAFWLGTSDSKWTSFSGLLGDVTLNIAVAFLLGVLSYNLERWGQNRKPRYSDPQIVAGAKKAA
ncbi:acyltransferase [Rhizobium sp. P38BS-XIX]|uniref:acyltransferase family protein n=1 Tax=Rhizobium sp. P38BS-XIX TaxID=2726740 RepID=UPI00145704FA|nr:acyltransferase [Rhizobium sp. P38BS-XIX]NLS00169.1 acyltransferase [Rhizobium sp. P38BS-XIX]